MNEVCAIVFSMLFGTMLASILIFAVFFPQVFNVVFLPLSVYKLKAVLSKRIQDVIAFTPIGVFNDRAHFEEKEMGHYEWCDKICITSLAAKLYPWVIWHEAAHAYHNYLDGTGSNFSETWRRIPKAILTGYGKTDYWEDLAVWVEEIYLDIGGYYSVFDVFWWKQYFVDLEPYRQKVALLLLYGFVGFEDMQKFLARNPCFNHLDD